MKSTNKNIFMAVLSGTGGFITAYIILGLFVTIFFGSGYYLIKKHNKKNTKLLKEIQPMQYLGILLCIIGIIPFIRYLPEILISPNTSNLYAVCLEIIFLLFSFIDKYICKLS